MKLSLIRTFTIAVLVLSTSAGVVFGDEVKNQRRSVQVALKLVDYTISYGELPNYSVTIKNISGETTRILDVKKRIDFRSDYCKLHIYSIDRKLELATSYSHSGPIDDSDYVSLKPNESLKYASKADLFTSKYLLPGRYEAYVIFWTDPYDFKSTIKSNVARFNVKKKTKGPSPVD